MKRALIAAAALCALAGPAFADTTADAPAAPVADAAVATPAATPVAAPAADPNVYQVLRTGDREMSCETLGAESNALNAKLMADANAAAKRAKGGKLGRTVAGNAAGGAMKIGGRMALGRVIGGMTPFGGLIAVAANDAIADSAAQKIASSGDQEPAATVTPEQQRMNHLVSIYREKGC